MVSKLVSKTDESPKFCNGRIYCIKDHIKNKNVFSVRFRPKPFVKHSERLDIYRHMKHLPLEYGSHHLKTHTINGDTIEDFILYQTSIEDFGVCSGLKSVEGRYLFERLNILFGKNRHCNKGERCKGDLYAAHTYGRKLAYSIKRLYGDIYLVYIGANNLGGTKIPCVDTVMTISVIPKQSVKILKMWRDDDEASNKRMRSQVIYNS